MLREWPPIEWDDDGYPTEESLQRLRALSPLSFVPDEVTCAYLRATLAECAERCCASYDEERGTSFATRDPVIRCLFSTGGWSGAEDLIDALLGNSWISYFHAEWCRGGHYVFEVPVPPAED